MITAQASNNYISCFCHQIGKECNPLSGFHMCCQSISNYCMPNVAFYGWDGASLFQCWYLLHGREHCIQWQNQNWSLSALLKGLMRGRLTRIRTNTVSFSAWAWASTISPTILIVSSPVLLPVCASCTQISLQLGVLANGTSERVSMLLALMQNNL